MDNNKPMTTAKELAFKAFLENIDGSLAKEEPSNLKERFENWWGIWFHTENHRECFYDVNTVIINGVRYIKAE